MARILIGSIAPNIHGLDSADAISSDDELILYDSSSSKNRKTKLSDIFSCLEITDGMVKTTVAKFHLISFGTIS